MRAKGYSYFVIWSGVVWGYIPTGLAYVSFKLEEGELKTKGKLSENMEFLAGCALTMEFVSTLVAIIVFVANRMIKIRAVNNFEDVHGALDQANRQAIGNTWLPVIWYSAAGASILLVLSSRNIINLVHDHKNDGMSVEDKRFITDVQIINIVVAMLYGFTIYIAYKDTEVVYLADMPEVQPEDAAENDGNENYEMEQRDGNARAQAEDRG